MFGSSEKLGGVKKLYPYPFSENMTSFLIFSKAIRDIENIIAASDRPN